jgi:ParB family transcriptional regulator, chromosome partitioning protein
MTTTMAENLPERPAAHPEKEKDKEKVEKRRALGRGLESLLPGPRAVVPSTPVHANATSTQQVPSRPAPPPSLESPVIDAAGAAAGVPAPAAHEDNQAIPISSQPEPRVPGTQVVNIALDLIDRNPYQTRQVEDDEPLHELADSIQANGVMQPIIVRPTENGRYILVLGERRCKASIKIGKATIPAIVRRVSDQQAAEMTVIENLQRLDLSCLEQARAFRVLSQQFNLTQQQIGERVGLSRESVSNYMRLLKLPPSVLDYMDKRQLGFTEARELLKLEDPELIAKAADYIIKRQMTLDQIETLILRMLGLLEPVPGMPGQAAKKAGARWVDPNVRAAQLDMERLLGVRVRIRDRKGKGKIVIEYSTVDDYDRVVGMLRGKAN